MHTVTLDSDRDFERTRRGPDLRRIGSWQTSHCPVLLVHALTVGGSEAGGIAARGTIGKHAPLLSL